MRYDAIVIGAGPYGLAAAAFLRKIPGFSLGVFGEPMHFWRTGMPAGMLLRSAWSASNIADPEAALTLDAYKIYSGNHLAAPITLERFVSYGLWHQRSAVPELDTRRICSVAREGNTFRLTLEDNQECRARRVIMAAGISAFAHKPAEFSHIPEELASHTSEQHNLAHFARKRVVVVGGGQSALESAALLHEIGCEVEVIARQPRIHWLGWKERLQRFGPASRLLFSPSDVGPAGISRVVSSPNALRKLPRSFQDRLRVLSTRPAGARWLVDRLRDVPVLTGTRVRSAAVVNGAVKLSLSNGEDRVADHVLLGTGYKVEAGRYKFLEPALLAELETRNGFPRLGSGFESSVRGLHFLGAPAAWSYGPMMCFVSGTRYAAQTLRNYLMFENRGRA